MITLTEQHILDGASQAGGWNAKQFYVLGVKYPPRHGWKHRLIGTQISEERYQKFLELRGASKSQQKKQREFEELDRELGL